MCKASYFYDESIVCVCHPARHNSSHTYPLSGTLTGAVFFTASFMLDIRNLFLSYDAADGPVQALSNVSLDVAPGEFISLIGPSGCGKTTLLRAIADLEHPQSGSIAVHGLTPEQSRLQRRYGYVFQAPALYPWRNVLRNVALPLEIFGEDKTSRLQKARRYLDLVQLAPFERKYPWQLSGGMQQRVSIARALAFDPALLLMDEPFGALDEIVREKLNDHLLNLWRETSKTIIFVTHSIAEAAYLSSRIVVMSPRPGRISDIIESDLPKQRHGDIRQSEAFFHLTQRIRVSLQAAYDDAH